MPLTDSFRHSFLNIYLPLLLFVVCFTWKFNYIDVRDICLDEPFSIYHAQKSPGEIIALSMQGEPNPPLFMLLLHFWIGIFGIGPASVRFLPLLFNSLTIVFIYFTGKRFFSPWSGLIASGMFMLSSFHFFHGLEVRTYSLLSLATAASLYFYLRLVHDLTNKRLIIALTVSNIALVYAHHFGWLVIFVEFLAGFLYSRNRKSLLACYAPIVITGIVYIPFFIVLFRQFLHSSQGTWIAPPTSGMDYIYELQKFLNHKLEYKLLKYLLIAGLVYSVYRKTWKHFSKDLLIIFAWWFIPFTAMFLVSFKIPMFLIRYTLFNSIGFYVFTGAAIYQLYGMHKYLVPAIGLVLLGLTSLHLRILPAGYSYKETGNATTFIRENKKEKDLVIIYPYWANLGFAYHYDRELFKNTDDFDQQLERQHIYAAWGFDNVKGAIQKERSTRILYMLDGPAPGNDDGIYDYLRNNYAIEDSASFPEGITVSIFRVSDAQ